MDRIFGSAGIRLSEFFKAASHDADNDIKIKRKSASLCGETGCGKKLLLSLIAKEYEFNLIEMNLPKLYSDNPTNIYHEVLNIFQQTLQNKKSVIYLKNLEQFNDYSSKMCIYALFDLTSSSMSNVLIVSTLKDIKKLDPSIFSLFEENIQISALNAPQRLEAFNYFLKAHNVTVPDLRDFAKSCYGYNISDILSLCSNALMKCYIENKEFNTQYMIEAKTSIIPCNSEPIFSSQLNSFQVKLKDIGGITEIKKQLEEAIIWPYSYPRLFKRLNFRPPIGILLYGPPGTGKTMIAKALASELDANFMVISSADLVKSEIGKSEKAIAKTFETAKLLNPTIIFIDEIESLFSRHESSGNLVKKMVSQMIDELDKLSESDYRVTVLASTNSLELVSKDLLRPGFLN
ncbi:hypothetical protein BB561_000475 [Smittium simulii]|uniref:AAA+ ATPase domain-containing protein n=1 Tax=Smittium simulii TaxID=133385 RepID=A0A2T9YYW8_9FUNG|nr:hypothetical protein BB561_000475 [Smittium simulii]